MKDGGVVDDGTGGVRIRGKNGRMQRINEHGVAVDDDEGVEERSYGTKGHTNAYSYPLSKKPFPVKNALKVVALLLCGAGLLVWYNALWTAWDVTVGAGTCSDTAGTSTGGEHEPQVEEDTWRRKVFVVALVVLGLVAYYFGKP